MAIWLTQSQSKFQDTIKWQAAHIACWRSQLNKPTQILLLSAPINDKNTEINGICEYRYIHTFDYINGINHSTESLPMMEKKLMNNLILQPSCPTTMHFRRMHTVAHRTPRQRNIDSRVIWLTERSRKPSRIHGPYFISITLHVCVLIKFSTFLLFFIFNFILRMKDANSSIGFFQLVHFPIFFIFVLNFVISAFSSLRAFESS